MKSLPLLLLIIFSFLLSFSSAEQCGRQAEGALCPNGLCCSSFGFCGATEAYCALPGCQSQCTPDDTPSPPPPPPTPPPSPLPPSPSHPPPSPDPTGGLTDIITRSQFDEMLNHKNDGDCPGRGFYTYDAFIAAAKIFHNFGMVGDTASRKRELAAFFGQTYYQSGGYCYKEEVNPPSDYCFPQKGWPCAPGKRYYGRGPMMLTGNYNYGLYGLAIGADLLNNPDLVSSDPVIAFRVAILFWMKPSAPAKPRSHDVINGLWYPSKADIAAQRFPGYGVITNIINGGKECGHGPDKRNADRIESYVRCCYILGATPGPNIDCSRQRPFDSASFLKAAI